MKLLLTVLAILLCSPTHAQSSLQGKWYLLSSGVPEMATFDFGQTTVTATMDSPVPDQAPQTRTAKIIQVIRQNGRLYYLANAATDSSKIELSIVSLITPDSVCTISNATGEHGNFSGIDEVKEFIQGDTLQRPAFLIFSEKEMARLRQLRDVSSMTKSEYKSYLTGLIRATDRLASLPFNSSKANRGGFALIFYLTNQAYAVLASLGYNPIMKKNGLNELDDKFDGDEGLKALRSQAYNFSK